MKSSRSASCLAALAAAAVLAGCGLSTNDQGTLTLNASPPPGSTASSGGLATQEVRPAVTDFHAIESKAVASLLITDGQPFKVIVEGEEKALPMILTDVKDGVLQISMDSAISTSVPIKITISMPKLDKLTNSGVGEVRLNDIKETSLSIKASGAGSLSATGNADMVDLTMSGVGSADISKLQAKAVTALLSGTGSAKVFATESLTGTVSGIGKLTYSGNPPKVQKVVSGLGAITPQ